MSETRKNVLIIDDEAIVLKSARRILERKGHSVLCAENGFDAMDILKNRASEVGVILLDQSMPGMDGEEALEKILAVDPDAKVILFSGLAPDQLEHLLHKGAVGQLKKPFEISELLAIINYWLP